MGEQSRLEVLRRAAERTEPGRIPIIINTWKGVWREFPDLLNLLRERGLDDIHYDYTDYYGWRDPAAPAVVALGIRAGAPHDRQPLAAGQAVAVAHQFQTGRVGIAAAQQPAQVGHGRGQPGPGGRRKQFRILRMRPAMAACVRHGVHCIL